MEAKKVVLDYLNLLRKNMSKENYERAKMDVRLHMEQLYKKKRPPPLEAMVIKEKEEEDGEFTSLSDITPVSPVYSYEEYWKHYNAAFI